MALDECLRAEHPERRIAGTERETGEAETPQACGPGPGGLMPQSDLWPTTRWPTTSTTERTEPGADLKAAVGDARITLDILAGKWVAPIVTVLMSRPHRHGDLHGAVGLDVSQKVLTETLRRMERVGLVSREVRAEVPPAVIYALTDLGQTLIEPITHLARWAATHSWRLPR